MTIRLQHPVPGGQKRTAELCVTENGSVLGLIRPDPRSDKYRFFPGTNNRTAFSFQHRDVAELIAIVTSSNQAAADAAARGPEVA